MNAGETEVLGGAESVYALAGEAAGLDAADVARNVQTAGKDCSLDSRVARTGLFAAVTGRTASEDAKPDPNAP